MDGYIDQNRGVYNIISEVVFSVHKTCDLWTETVQAEILLFFNVTAARIAEHE
jgi:hypothetical protein